VTRSFSTKQPLSTGTRVWAPFAGQEGSSSLKDMDRREAFYDHGYRQAGEHYHKTFEELEDCPLLRPDGWQPPVRKEKNR
jgi:hypothetical protein